MIHFGSANRIPLEPLLRYSFSEELGDPCKANLPSTVSTGCYFTLAGAIYRVSSFRPIENNLPRNASTVLAPLLAILQRERNHTCSPEERAALIRELGPEIQQAYQLTRLLYPPSV